MDVPESMKAELARSGASDLEEWASLEGRLALAVGYTTIFWPEFEEADGYIVRKGWHPEALRGFAQHPGATQRSVEWVMNHIHLVSLHALPDPDVTSDKLIVLGNVLADIYRAKLAWQFPNKPREVEFYVPENREDLVEYQLSFWQADDGEPDVQKSSALRR